MALERNSIVWWGERPYLVLATYDEPTAVLETPSGRTITMPVSQLLAEGHG